MDSAWAVWLPRDFLGVAGPDAVAYLQGQLSQDIAALSVEGSAWSLLLEPQGKVDALVRVTRTSADELVLDVDAGWRDAVVARLQRFKLRVKADLEPLDWRCLAVRGATHAAGGLEVVPAWGPGFDLIGDAPVEPDGVAIVDLDVYERERIERGWPAMGAELTDATIPHEAGIVATTVSFTKGCYTGQELVARIDSRGGNVPRRLRTIVVDGAVEPAVGSTLFDDTGEDVGTLTSVAGDRALAYVKRKVEPPAAVTLRWNGASSAATVQALPS